MWWMLGSPVCNSKTIFIGEGLVANCFTMVSTERRSNCPKRGANGLTSQIVVLSADAKLMKGELDPEGCEQRLKGRIHKTSFPPISKGARLWIKARTRLELPRG